MSRWKLMLSPKYLYHQSRYSKTWDSKYLAPVAQMVRTFTMIPKFGRFESLLGWDILCLNIFDISSSNPFVHRKWMCYPCSVNISNLNFINKNTNSNMICRASNDFKCDFAHRKYRFNATELVLWDTCINAHRCQINQNLLTHTCVSELGHHCLR